MQNSRNFAQAKESAGNLTGTGYGKAVGRAAEDASTAQGAFLADLLMRMKEARANRYAGLLGGLATSGVAPPTTSYQPGFLDYLTQAGSSVVGAAGEAGGFGKLF